MADGAIYIPNLSSNSAVEQIKRSDRMRQIMAEQGQRAVNIAASYSPTPDAIEARTVMAYGRWAVNVINTAPDARKQEYGTWLRRAVAPLGRALAVFWREDPNFWKRGR